MKQALLGGICAVVVLVATSCGSEPTDRNVLFVGNSFTFGNDVPDMVEQIAGENGSNISTVTMATGGRFLDEHLVDNQVVAAIQSGEYDYVVLQEQSMAPADAATFQSRTLPAVVALDAMADASATQVVLYQTWGHLNGNTAINQPNYSSMQDDLITSYDTMAAETGASVARVGQAWQRFLPESGGVTLHADDGIHASEAGSYLAATVLANWLSTEPIREAPSIGSIDDALADQLLSASW